MGMIAVPIALGLGAMICVTAITLYALSLGHDSTLIAGTIAGILGLAGGGAAYGTYKLGQSKGADKLIKMLEDLKKGADGE